jgi:hypothetical protein
VGVCSGTREGLAFNKGRFLNDRHGSLVIYAEGARNPHAIAKREAQKVLKTTKDVPIEDLFAHRLPNGQEVYIAVYPYRKEAEK